MKIAIVTGASSGMGAEFVRQLAATEPLDEIWVIARRKERLDALAAQLRTPLVPLCLDLAKPESFAALRDRLAAQKPEVSVLVNAAGFGKYGTYLDLTDEEIDRMIDVNDKATIHVTYTVLPYMRAGGRILTIGSASAFQPLPYFNLYASTKAFIVHFCRALNVELKSRQITVTSVCPGYVDTEFFRVAQDTKNPNTCQNFTPLYRAKDVVRKALRDSKRGRDLSVLGATTKTRRWSAKLLPTKLVMHVWLKIK